ncbi:hypothetical protein PENTCL1PPCAC_9373, partial [Pristionchus entomophagus]
SVLRWRMVTDERLVCADTTNFEVAITVSNTAVPPLHVLVPAGYPARPASVLFEKTFPKTHAPLRRLGETVEARLATAPLSLQGRVHAMAEVYKGVCEVRCSSLLNNSFKLHEQQLQMQQSPSPSSESSSSSTSPAEPQPATVTPPTIPILHHLPTTFRPQAKFRPAVDGSNVKSRMVY